MSCPRSRPDLAERFPLILSCAKSRWFCESQHRNLPSLRRSATDPPVEIHSDTARARGIGSGDWVRIDTPKGTVRARAKLNANLDPQVVYGQHGLRQTCDELGLAGHPPFGQDSANLNLVLPQQPSDPISGSSPLAPQPATSPPGAADAAGVVSNRVTAPRQADDQTRPTS